MENCILCKLNREEFEVTKVYEDNIVSVIMDIKPVNTGHMLVVPKECKQLVIDLDDDVVSHMFKIAKKVNKALRLSGLNCGGVNYVLSDGEVASQEIPHCHLHVIPRFSGDGFGFRYPADYNNLPTRAEIEAAAEKIRKQIC